LLATSKIYAYICLAVQKSKQQIIFKKLDLVNFDQISAISKFINTATYRYKNSASLKTN